MRARAVLVERTAKAAKLTDTIARLFFTDSARHNPNPSAQQDAFLGQAGGGPVTTKPTPLRLGELLTAEGCLETWARRRLRR